MKLGNSTKDHGISSNFLRFHATSAVVGIRCGPKESPIRGLIWFWSLDASGNSVAAVDTQWTIASMGTTIVD